MQYLCHWKGWPRASRTWETERQMREDDCGDLIEAYEEQVKEAMRARQTKADGTKAQDADVAERQQEQASAREERFQRRRRMSTPSAQENVTAQMEQESGKRGTTPMRTRSYNLRDRDSGTKGLKQ